METGPETGVRPAQARQFRKNLFREGVEVVRPAVGQRALRLAPDAFIGIEFGSVAGEVFDMKARMPDQEAADVIAFVNLAVVPEKDHVAGQMPKQVTQKGADFRAADVHAMELIVEGDPMALRADRQSGNQRHLAMLIAVSGDRRLSPRRPGAADRSDQQEAGFVQEDEVGAQVQRPFFMRGHSSRFHCSIRSSLRSKARRSGFWQLHRRRWRSRPT
jgi:hypothetical protein